MRTEIDHSSLSIRFSLDSAEKYADFSIDDASWFIFEIDNRY